MATAKYPPSPRPSPFWCLWQAARGLEGSHITVPDADLRGKWVVITGGNNGIGREACLQFASWGANIVLGCRQPPPHETHPDATVSDCIAAARAAGHKSSTIEWWPCDMTDLASVGAFAKRWLSTGNTLDILSNNAGMGRTASGKLTRTKDGFELVHQINFLSHVFLTMNILPSFAKSEDARIICTTSCMQYLGRFDLSNANTTADPHSYCHNKLYLQTFLTELQSRLSKVPSMSHVALHGVHPGYVDTGIWTRVQATGKEEASPQNFGERLDNLLVHYFGVTPQQGSLAIVRAATAKECAVSQRGGEGGARYFNRIWPAVPMPQTVSPIYRQQIWEYIDEQLHLEEKGLLDIFKDE